VQVLGLRVAVKLEEKMALGRLKDLGRDILKGKREKPRIIPTYGLSEERNVTVNEKEKSEGQE
jgi:hypothetical protein